jgi:hypothetical protein
MNAGDRRATCLLMLASALTVLVVLGLVVAVIVK